MRILLDYRPALRTRTGVGEYVHELARALVTLGGDAAHDEVLLFSSSWRHRLDPKVLPGCAVVDRRIPVRCLNFAWHRLEWPPAERLAGPGLDVVHSLHPLLLPARRAAQVVTVHDLDFLAHPERTRAEIRRDYPALAAAHVGRADHVIVNSQYTASEVGRIFGVPASRLTVCSPGAPEWSPRDPRVRGGYVLFMGTLEPRKNVGTLLDAWAALVSRRPEVPELILAGQPTPAAGPWLARLGRAPLAGRARAIGYVPAERRRVVFEGAAVLAVPSYHEGFGIPALEAMSMGVPVVAANQGALPEVVGDAGLLVDPHDATQLAAAIERVLTDAALAATLGARGRSRAARYTWRAAAAAARVAYARAIEQRKGRHD